MKNTYTATQQKELFAKDCKLINLKYEYTGYIGQEKWAIVSELSEQELFEKYPDEVKKYIPFVLLSVEQGKAIQAYNRNEDKYRKRQNNNKIIAIVRRKDGIEEKWVVVPDGVTFSKEEIRRQIHFQEQYFDSEIVM